MVGNWDWGTFLGRCPILSHQVESSAHLGGGDWGGPGSEPRPESKALKGEEVHCN